MSLNTLTPKQLQEKLGIPLGSQANLRSRGQLPYAKLGRKIVYFADEIEKLLRRHYIPVADEEMAHVLEGAKEEQLEKSES